MVRLANAPPGSFADLLTRQYNRLSSTVQVNVVPTTSEATDAVMHGEADITLTSADIAYFAYRTSDAFSRDAHPLRAIATLQVVPVHLVVGPNSSIRTALDLRDHVVGLPAVAITQELMLKALGLGGDVRRFTTGTPPQGIPLLAEGKVDALFVTSYYPSQAVELAARQGARLISVTGPGIDQLRRDYPFIRAVAIPAHTYPNQNDAVYTVGVEVIYLCRRDLPEPVVHELTSRLFDALPDLARNFVALRALDVKQAPATVLPLHEGAARYYRERELLR
jgi:TRAP transporter TAXI family solute receptor